MSKLKPGINLYEHQRKGKDFIKRRKYVLIGDEPGLGKSLQALAAMSEVDGLKLIICPSFLRLNWKNEIKKFTTMSCEVVDSKTEYIKIPEILITSYENVKNIPTDLLPNFIVMDESHYIKNLKAARSKNCIRMVQKSEPEYLVALSGTPILNNVTEFFTILKLLSLCPSKSNGLPLAQKSQYGFSAKFSNSSTRTINVSGRNGSKAVSVTEYKGVRNLETLKKLLQGKFLRRLAKNVLDLPKVTHIPFIVNQSKNKADSALHDAYLAWLDKELPSDHITQLKISSAMSKVPYTCKIALELLEQGEQIVIFSDHKDPVDALQKTIKKAGYSVGMLTGEIDTDKRDFNVSRFQSGHLNVIIGTIKAASVGITLTAARHMIFNDSSWVPADMVQAERRIDRISQTRPVTITKVLNGDFDIKLEEKLASKRREIGQIYE